MTAPVPAEPVIGRTRARFRMHWPWYTWVIPFLVPLVPGALILLTGDVLAAVITVIILVLLATLPLLWVLASFRIHVTDRAIVTGPFLPGFTRSVHLFQDIDVSTIRAWSNVSAYLRSSRTPALLTAGQVNRGSRHGISFRVRRIGDMRGGQLRENQMTRDLGGTAEIMSVTGGAERLIRSLATAMQDAGVAPADAVIAQALPPGRLSPERDSHLQQIPGWPQPSEERFEDLPPEVQQRLRDHLRRD